MTAGRFRQIFGVDKPLIAMCHLRALPGRPRHDVAGGMDALVEALAADVAALQQVGVDGLLFCNEHDIPYQLRVGPEIGAGQAAVLHPRGRGQYHDPDFAAGLEPDVSVRVLVAGLADGAGERHLLAAVVAAPAVMRHRGRAR